MNFQIKMTTIFNAVYNVGTAVGQGVGFFLESPVKKCLLLFFQSLYSEHQSN